MKCLYECTIRGICPVDGTADDYHLIVESSAPIMVERILDAIKELPSEPMSQEQITAAIWAELPKGTTVTTIGSHSSVITTVACE
jgi:hypothetical protein